MKKTLYYLTMGICFLSLIGCNNTQNNPSIEYIPVKEDKGDKWGFIDASGKMMFVNEFEKQPSMIINGVFSVEENHGFSLYTVGEKPTLIPNCEELKGAGVLSEGLIPIVRKDERITLINKEGKSQFVLEPIKNQEVIGCRSGFVEGNLIIELQNGKYGSINPKGETVIDPIYDEIGFFSEGIIMVLLKDEEESSKKTIIALDDKGKEVFRLKDNYIFSNQAKFIGGRLAIKKGEVLGYLNKKGEFTKLPDKIKEYSALSDKYFAFKNDEGKWGVLDKENETILRAKYDDISLVEGNDFFVKNGEDYQIVNSEGNLIKEFDEKLMLNLHYFYDYLGLKSTFWFIGGKTNSIMFFDREGKTTTKNDFYDISLYVNISGEIKSDYFNLNNALVRLSEYIGENGTPIVTLGKPIKNYLKGSASDYQFQYAVGETVRNFDVFKASLSIMIGSDECITDRDPVYTYYEYGGNEYRYLDGYRTIWNNSALVSNIELELEGPQDIFNVGKKLLIGILQNKGFKLDSDAEAYSIMSNDNMKLLIYCPEDNNKIEVDLMTKEWFKNLNYQYYINCYRKAYDQNITNNDNLIPRDSKSDTEIEEEPVEEVIIGD